MSKNQKVQDLDAFLRLAKNQNDREKILENFLSEMNSNPENFKWVDTEDIYIILDSYDLDVKHPSFLDACLTINKMSGRISKESQEQTEFSGQGLA